MAFFILERRFILGGGILGTMSQTVLKKIKDVDRKLDKIKGFLQDVFITSEEYSLIKETDSLVGQKKFDEFVTLDDL